MTAVIYARYSSDNQREESIEGQIRECTAYAEKNGITVVKHYIDRALSAKTDNRPDFQQMIKDSEKRLFDIVLVWKLDRFARNRYDSAHYEYQLERNHVKLVSATEPISDSPAGIMVKSMLTGMAEYYSAELSEKVVRGMTENVLKGKYNGGTIPIGFKVDEEKFFQIDPLKAPFVVEAFQRYNDGATMKELMNWLNDSGVTTNRNQKFTYNSVQTLLTNKRYIGENHFKDIVMPDSIPAIVDKDLFEEVQLKIKKNSRAPARHKAEDDYLLTTKLFCGMCGAMMFGECGTGRNKVVHHYYKCSTAKRFKTCKKKTVRKEWLEDLVIAETMKLIQDDAVIDAIVAEVMELQDQENTTLPLLEKQMREVENGIENMLNAIQAGVLTNSTKSRLEKLEAQQKELEVRIAEEKIARPRLSENQVRFWLTRFRKLDPNVKSHRETLINTFVNAVYLYDEKVLITFNYKDGTKTITFDEIAAKDAPEGNGSDLGCFAPPRSPVSEPGTGFSVLQKSSQGWAGGFEQQRSRPPPVAETGRRGWGRAHQKIFSELRKKSIFLFVRIMCASHVDILAGWCYSDNRKPTGRRSIMAKTSTNISLDPELKRSSQELFADLGIDLSTAITLFLKQSLRVQGLPFAVTRENPNAETAAALNEYAEMKAHPEKYKRYASFKDAMDEVLADV